MKKLIFILLLFPSLCWGWTPQTAVLGPADGNPDQPVAVELDNLGSSGQDAATTWKTFRWEANASGDVYVFSVRMTNVLSSSTNINVAYAIYEDNPTGPVPGALKVWGYENGHNFYTDPGCGGVSARKCFDIQTVVTNRTITAGNYYWIAFRSTLGTDGGACSTVSCFERGNGGEKPYAGWVEKCISSATFDVDDMSQDPPTPTHWSTRCGGSIADNIYGWSAWTASDAGPTITTTGGTWTHGSTNATITGYSFGTKSPPAPLWWDDAEGPSDQTVVSTSSDIPGVTTTLSSGSQYYLSALPNASWEGGVPASSRIQYRAYPYRSVTAPHSRSNKMITGCHDPIDECLGGEAGQNVLLTMSDGSRHDQWYIMYWLRLDPAWPAASDYPNYKYMQWEVTSPYTFYSIPMTYEVTQTTSGACGGYRAGIDGLLDWWGCPTETRMISWGSGSCPVLTDPTCGYPIVTKDYNKANPVKGWTHQEHILDAASDLYIVKVSNKDLLNTNNGAGCTVAYSGATAPGGITIGGFWRTGWCGGTNDDLDENAWRYFDDVYIDTTLSRVMLCNDSTYTSATICEPQIPSAWTDGAITVKVNQGALTNGKNYLFVFDSDNVSNATGYEVMLGSGVPSAQGCTISGGTFR